MRTTLASPPTKTISIAIASLAWLQANRDAAQLRLP